MKKKYISLSLSLLFLFLSNVSNAQEGPYLPLRFLSTASIISNYQIKNYDVDSAESILFVFKGDGENFSWVHHFLSNRLIRNWGKKVTVGFQYDLKFDKGKQPEWMERPKYGNPLEEYDMKIEIRLYNFRKKIFHGNYEDSYLVNIEMIDPKTNELMEFTQLKTENRRERVYGDWFIAELLDEILYE